MRGPSLRRPRACRRCIASPTRSTPTPASARRDETRLPQSRALAQRRHPAACAQCQCSECTRSCARYLICVRPTWQALGEWDRSPPKKPSRARYLQAHAGLLIRQPPPGASAHPLSLLISLVACRLSTQASTTLSLCSHASRPTTCYPPRFLPVYTILVTGARSARFSGSRARSSSNHGSDASYDRAGAPTCSKPPHRLALPTACPVQLHILGHMA